MREILFRGKRIDNGEWVEGYLLLKYFHESPRTRFVIQYKTKYNPEMWQPEYAVAEIIPETVGQYTGLCDKNGKKIFEGDICRVGNFNYKVEFKYSSWQFAILTRGVWCNPYFDSNCGEKCEVIGNIHDNPELLEVDNG